MQDLLPIPTCFYSGQKPAATIDPNSTKLGQSLVVSAYRTRMNGQDRAVTVTWCKNLLAHGLSVSVEGSSDDNEDDSETDARTQQQYVCRVEMRPWSFWRRHGSKRFHVEGTAMKPVDVFWDLRSASWHSDEPEPLSDYCVAVVYDAEVVLLLGDLKKDAFRRTGARPSMFDAVLVSRREHVFGKRRFATRAKFHDKGKFHAVTIEWINSTSATSGVVDSDMVIKIDGNVCLEVKHLQWKFRGNESISVDNDNVVDNVKVEVYWDVHDWLFSPGLRHALFIFKPVSVSVSVSPPSEQGKSDNNDVYSVPSDYCLFLYAWKLE